MQLGDPVPQRERRRRRPPIRPVEGERDLALVGKTHDDAGAASLAQVSHDGQRATDERVDGMGDDDRFRRWSDLRWGLVR
jgi:hypothetical protein